MSNFEALQALGLMPRCKRAELKQIPATRTYTTDLFANTHTSGFFHHPGCPFLVMTVSSVVVVFELVAYGDDGNDRLVFDFEQRDVARSPERNDQFS